MRDILNTAQVGSQRVILRVTSGPLAYTKVVLETGQALRVGRSNAADLSIPSDIQMSDLHFELSWDGSTCHIADLCSTTGIALDGETITQSVLGNKSWVRAGATDFIVHFEEISLRCTPARQVSPAVEVHKIHVLESLRQRPDPLFAVLDAARDERILPLLRESIEDFCSLYEGPQGQALAEVAPYLVSLPRNSRLLDVLVDTGWGDSWGIYLSSQQSLLEMRRHLRKFLMVKLEGAERHHYFRFYDPRVLRLVEPVYTNPQRRAFFGPITCLLFETDEGGLLQLVPSDTI